MDVCISQYKVEKEHCIFRNKEGEVTIEQLSEGSIVYVNGQLITQARILNHLDRICIGIYSFFLFMDPSCNENILEFDSIDYEFCKMEIGKIGNEDQQKNINEVFQQDLELTKQQHVEQLQVI